MIHGTIAFIVVLYSIFFLENDITISGTVNNSKGEPLVGASVVLTDSSRNHIDSYTFTNKEGYYILHVKNRFSNYMMTVRFLGYEEYTIPINMDTVKTNITHHIILKDSYFQLEEVTVTAKAPPIKVRGDTLTYNVSYFIDSTESVIEDVLKKLPGIEVTEDGNIKYKDKSIKAVLFEGDDLFGSNYKLATQNIDAQIIEQVQAIENYDDNEATKGIVDSDEVVLNIKAKKDAKFKPYVNISLGYGNENKYFGNASIILLNHNLKYYVSGQANNIGLGEYNLYSDYNPNDPQQTHAPQLIDISNYNIAYDIGPQRSNFNQFIQGNGNALYKLSKNMRIRANISIDDDKKTAKNNDITTFILDSGNIIIDEERNEISKPTNKKADIHLKYTPYRYSVIQYKGKMTIAKTTIQNLQTASIGDIIETLTNSSTYINHHVSYTQRVSSAIAMETQVQYEIDDRPQTYILSPALQSSLWIMPPSNIDRLNNKQESHVKVNNFNIITSLFGANSHGNYAFQAGHNDASYTLNSELFFIDSLSQKSIHTGYTNKSVLNTINSFIKGKYILKLKPFAFDFDLSLQRKHYTMTYANIPSTEYKNTYLTPSIRLSLNTNPISWVLSYGYNQFFSSLNDLYGEYILTNYRNLNKGIPEIVAISSHALYTLLEYENLENLFSIRNEFRMYLFDQQYSQSTIISNNETIRENVLLPGNKNYNFSTTLNKYFHTLSLGTKIKTAFSWFEYYNIINTKTRKNSSFSATYDASISTLFSGFFNTKIGGKYIYRSYKTESTENSNNKKDIKVYADITIKPSSYISFIIKNDLLMYNVDRINQAKYYFTDFTLEWTIKKNKLSLALSGKNILNNTLYQRRNITDYYTYLNEVELLPRYIMASMKYRL